ncbi:ras association domain-containing protein 1-like [Hetaerina americana]|uniref:ras association domain-containing protein 1-like n=1 Tax=Hetaerina americana TaxID=62018 RepID=UPI003A7F2655
MSSSKPNELPNHGLSPGDEASSEPLGYQDWHARFNQGIGDFFNSWSVFSPFRRRASKRQTSDCPERPNVEKECLPPEQIELVHFQNSKAPDSFWESMHGKYMTPSNVFTNSDPIIVASKPNGSRNEGKHAVDVPSKKEENICAVSLKKLAALLWEEPDEGHGAGHDFVYSHSSNPTWCDKCGDLLWGIYQAKYMRCQYCHYTCHPQCRDYVTLDCRAFEAGSSGAEELSTSDQSNNTDNDTTEAEAFKVDMSEGEDYSQSSFSSGEQTPEKSYDMMWQSKGELKCLVEDYTKTAPPGLGMTLEEDGTTFHGFIRVHLNLSRPISVVAGSRPPSIYDILKEDETLEKTLTSFYLPRDTVKALHITSETTTHEVVVALLKKFKVVDNPRKFALYERFYEDGDVNKAKMRRIAENEKPLILALKWHQLTDCNKMFALQENETEDILWEAFTLPELGNFLRILDREEEEYKKKVEQKYELMALKLQEAMEKLKHDTETDASESDARDGISSGSTVEQGERKS